MPQIIVDDKHIGEYNELVEYFADKGHVTSKGRSYVHKLNMVLLLILLTIAVCNSIAIKKLNDDQPVLTC